ncbi:response regulator [Hydrogenophaga sp. MI9]|uniref:response regulator n=1 Tax=Hydrogenophaga sp. MI9 TaxID=3453719 RepID=UPI003EEF459C
MTRSIQLLLVDDHTLFRRGLKALLSQDERFLVAGEAGDVGEALRCLAQQRPDVILLDNHLPGVRGVDAIPALKEAAPAARVLMLTVSENENDLAAALQAGADGYLLKTVESDQLCETIVKVVDGESVISPEMMTKLVAVFRSRPSAAPTAVPAVAPVSAPVTPAVPREAVPSADLLSPREREILLLIARGDSNKLIARELDIAETTVKIHVQHILRKLGLSSRVQAAVFATSQGLA